MLPTLPFHQAGSRAGSELVPNSQAALCIKPAKEPAFAGQHQHFTGLEPGTLCLCYFNITVILSSFLIDFFF